jgi:heptosyltransferase-2
MATPIFDCLRNNYHESKLIAVIRDYVRGVIEDGPWFDHVIGTDDKSARGFYKLVRNIRRIRPDLAIVLPNSVRSALSIRLAGVKEIYGYRRNGRSWLLRGGPKPIQLKNGILPVPMVQYYMEICRQLGLALPDAVKPHLSVSELLEEKGNQLLTRYGIMARDMIIGLNPGAKFGSSKCWPPKYFAELAELLKARWDCKILLFVGPGEDQIAQSIVEMTEATIINTGPDKVNLALLKPLVRRCHLLITNDTGPRHYAVAFDVPVVVIMGPTDPRYTATNLEKTRVLREELECSPCHKKECPHDHDCMRRISPHTVFEASQKLLETFA